MTNMRPTKTSWKDADDSGTREDALKALAELCEQAHGHWHEMRFKSREGEALGFKEVIDRRALIERWMDGGDP